MMSFIWNFFLLVDKPDIQHT